MMMMTMKMMMVIMTMIMMIVMITLTSLADGFHTPHTNLVTGLITFHGNG